MDVTIFCLTYNHIDYIKSALEGFLMQKTQYTYNVLVFDDASTDGTSEVLREYKREYPDVFDIYIAAENTYNLPIRQKILRQLYRKYVKGKYVAWCEGDDYWTDCNKLQLQVDFMEKNPECSMTAHASCWIDCRNNETTEYRPYQDNRYLLDEEIILQANGNLSTASLVMRKEVFLREDASFPICDVEDFPMQLFALCKGKIFYFNRNMSVYRYMHIGSWSLENDSLFEKKSIHTYGMIDFLKKFDDYTSKKYHAILRQKCAIYLYGLIYPYLKWGHDSYYQRLNKLDKRIQERYGSYIQNQYRVFRILKDQYLLQAEDKEMIQNYKYVVIMGMGEYATHISNMLKKSNVTYIGNIVTKLQTDREKIPHAWELSTYPFNKKETLVIIGISQKEEQFVKRALEINDFSNLFSPVWIY